MNERPAHDLESSLRALTARVLSARARVAHVALLVASACMSALLAALLLTEPSLPSRTAIAFGVLLAIGMGWIAYATWVLRARRPLMARDRVVATGLALAATALFTTGMFSWSLATGARMAHAATLLGVALVLVAAVLLVQARRTRSRLLAQAHALGGA